MATISDGRTEFAINKLKEYVNNMKFYDTEHDCVVTIAQLKKEYDDLLEDPGTKAEYENVSFPKFVENCMVENNGTLEFI